MTTLHEAAQQALDALEEIHHGNMTPMAEGNWNKAIESLREALAQQVEQQPVAFDYQTAADFLNGKTINGELVSRFVSAARWAHDDNRSLRSVIQSLRGELAARDAEIAMLKNALMEAEAAPAAQHPAAEVIECGNSYAKVKLLGDAFGTTKVGDKFYTAAPAAQSVQGVAHPACKPDASKVIEQMLEELESATPNMCDRKSWRTAIQAGQKWLEENK